MDARAIACVVERLSKRTHWRTIGKLISKHMFRADPPKCRRIGAWQPVESVACLCARAGMRERGGG